MDQRLGHRENPLGLPRDGDILYSQELERYLTSFGDPKETMEKIENIWEEKGFIHPRDLTKTLLGEQVVDEEKQAILNNIIDASAEKDKLTGFDAKPMTPLLTGLAHLYGQTVGQQEGREIHMVEGDYGNMGGTNDYAISLVSMAVHAESLGAGRNDAIRELLGEDLAKSMDDLVNKLGSDEGFKDLTSTEQTGLINAQIDPSSGWGTTDLAARIAANIATEEVEKYGGEIFPVRSGGDEIRFIITNIPENHLQQALDFEVHNRIEDFTAQAGLHDHAHTKYLDNRLKDGFGLAFASADLSNPELDPATVVAELDKKIEHKKDALGQMRSGIDPDMQDKELTTKELLADVVSSSTGKVYTEVEAAAQWESAKGYLEEYAQHRAEELRDSKPVKALDAIHDVMNEHKSAGMVIPDVSLDFDAPTVERKLFEDPAKTRQNELLSLLNENDISVSQDEYKAFEQAMQNYEAIDPASGAKGERDLASMVKMIAEDSQAVIDQNPDLELTKGSLMHIEVGNLGAVNKAFGHHYADELLADQVSIINDVLKENGLKDASFSLTHEGGGKFKLPLPNAVEVDGEFQPVSPEMLRKISDEIVIKVNDDLNKQSILEYFSDKGLPVDRKAENALGEAITETTTFADLPHLKRPEIESGLNATVVTADLDSEIWGGKQVKELSRTAEMQINADRKEQMEAFVQENGRLEGQITEVSIQGAAVDRSVTTDLGFDSILPNDALTGLKNVKFAGESDSPDQESATTKVNVDNGKSGQER